MKSYIRNSFFAACAALTIAGNVHATDYVIDAEHSSVGFKIGHLGISSVSGRFGTFEGEFSYDPKNVSASSAHAKIDATSIDTDNKKRDDHLRSDDFLAASKYPAIEFKSKEVKGSTKDSFQVHGDLTIHGVTKPVVLDTKFGGTVKDMMGKERAAFVATTKLNRKDFGLTWSKLLETGGMVVGDEVEVMLEVEGVKKEDTAEAKH